MSGVRHVRLALQVQQECCMPSLPRAAALAQALGLGAGAAVSDLFVEGYVYKPLSAECLFIEDEALREEYKHLIKKAKKARYISVSVLERCGSGMGLLQGLAAGRLQLAGEYLTDALAPPAVPQTVLEERLCPPIQLLLTPAQRFECRIAAPAGALQGLAAGRRIGLCGAQFVLGVMTPETPVGEDRLLLAAAPAQGAAIAPDSASVFRLQVQDGRQVLAAGSVLCGADAPGAAGGAAPYLYAMRNGGARQ